MYSENAFAVSIKEACSKGLPLLSVANNNSNSPDPPLQANVHHTSIQSNRPSSTSHIHFSTRQRPSSSIQPQACSSVTVPPISVRNRWSRYLTPKQSAQIKVATAVHTIQTKRTHALQSAIQGKHLHRTKNIQLQTHQQTRTKQMRRKLHRK